MFGAWGLVSRDTPSTGTTFYAFDARGNVAQRTNSSGAVTSTDVYDAYGQKRSGPADVWGFGGQAGYYTDGETGLVLCTHRFYDPQSGRFLTRDPIGYAGGINLYSYTQNNPVNLGDPSGLDPGYWQTAGQFALGEAKGFGNFAAGMTDGSAFDLVTGGRFHQPFNPGSSETEQNGASFGDTLALVGSFFTGEGEATAASRLLKGPCFAAGTLVQMGDGSTKPVEQVKQGDKVQSRNPDTGKTEIKSVTQIFVSQVPSVVTLSLGDAKTGAVLETLTCTPQHPFFVVGHGFTAAGQLTAGASLATRSGLVLAVLSVKVCSDKGYTVYNFEVADDHTYFVGKTDGGAWVHNDCTEIAADIIKERAAAGLEPGEVWNVQQPGGLKFPWDGVGRKYSYHDVVRVGDKVVDPYTHGHKNPVELGQWMQNFDKKTGGNGKGFQQYFNFSPGSAEAKRFAECMAK